MIFITINQLIMPGVFLAREPAILFWGRVARGLIDLARICFLCGGHVELSRGEMWNWRGLGGNVKVVPQCADQTHVSA